MSSPGFDTGGLLAVFLTLAMFSFLYRDNPVYRLAEHLFVGIAAGYFIVIQYHNVFLTNLWQPMTGSFGALFGGRVFSGWNLALIIPFAVGLLMFTQLSSTHAWLSRWPMSVVIGSFSGLAIIGFAQGDLIPQIHANLIPFIKPGAWSAFITSPGLFTFLDLLWNPILIIGVVSVLIYFFFSKPHTGAIGATASLGMGFLMISFGASYGNTVMTRISLLIERVMFMVSKGRLSLALFAGFVIYFLVADVGFKKRPAGTKGAGK
ncbi:hypothetical protein JW905_05210 [bacterium]|nr:hypothetical protein [candidate division CSSED10-310 bacterium]